MLLLAAGMGCEPPSEPGPVFAPEQTELLLAPGDWIVRSDGSASDCPPPIIQEEDGALEVVTLLCAAVVLEQSTPVELKTGDRIHWMHWHLNLWSPAAAEGNVRLTLDSHIVFEASYAVPGPADLEEGVWEVPEDIPAGSTVEYEVLNHGTNTWNLAPVFFSAPL